MDSRDRSDSIDAHQSHEYKFPYHYLPSPAGFPMFGKMWSYSASYIAAINLAKNWLTSIGAGDRAGHKHMDYGCGDGGFLHALKKDQRLNHIEFEGIDIDSRAIEWAGIFSSGDDSVLFSCGDLNHLPLESQDSGTLIEVLEHIPPNEAHYFVHGIARSLKKGGHLFVTVPSIEKPVEPKHYRHFDFDTLAAEFSSLFDIVECFGFERQSILRKIIFRCTFHGPIYIETPLTSRLLVRLIERKHNTLRSCGRIGLVLRKKTSA